MRSAQTVVIIVDGVPVEIMCADLADIVRSKVAADRAKDRKSLVLLQAQLAQRRTSRPTTGPDRGSIEF